jgi:hypothetical protein
MLLAEHPCCGEENAERLVGFSTLQNSSDLFNRATDGHTAKAEGGNTERLPRSYLYIRNGMDAVQQKPPALSAPGYDG